MPGLKGKKVGVFFLKMNGGREQELASATSGATGQIASAESHLRGLEGELDDAVANAASYRRQAAELKPLIGVPYKDEDAVSELRGKVRALEGELKAESAPVAKMEAGPDTEDTTQHALRAAARADTEAQTADQVRQHMKTLMESVMRYSGLPPNVGLALVDRIVDAATKRSADASYTHGLVTFAMDTKPEEIAQKLFHEVVHALLDPKLQLIGPIARRALDVGAAKYLAKPAQRAAIEAAYGTDPQVVHEEAIARMAERALAAAMRQPPALVRAADRMVNFVRGTGQALRGEGFTTADDVFRTIMQGRLAPADAGAALQAATAAAGRSLHPDAPKPAPAPRQAPAAATPPPAKPAKTAPATVADRASQIAAGLPETYKFAKRDKDKNQVEMFGGDSAKQAQAARDAQGRGALRSSTAQLPMDEGLFAPDPKAQKAMFALRAGPLQTKVLSAFGQLRDAALNRARDTADALFPMRDGSPAAQATVFQFANAQREIVRTFGGLAEETKRQFSPEMRNRMGVALDNQSEFEVRIRKAAAQMEEADRAQFLREQREAFEDGGTGIAGLPVEARNATLALNELSRLTWNRMQQRGIVPPGGDGIPYYMPRSFVMMGNADDRPRHLQRADQLDQDGGGKAGRRAGRPLAGMNDFHEFGRNLNTSGPMGRNYETTAEALAAAQAKFGKGVTQVTDILALVAALTKNERAVAGRDLVDAIKAYGEGTEDPTVVEGRGVPDGKRYFTLNHPSMQRWLPDFEEKDDGSGDMTPRRRPDGSIVMVQAPIHVSTDFEGPLNAVLTRKTPGWYRGFMKLKGIGMGLIMFSPLMHLVTEVGRALPAMPGKVMTGRVFADGHRGLADEAVMKQAVADGLAPVTQSWGGDAVSVLDENINPFGHGALRSWVGAKMDAVARNGEKYLGKFAGDVLRDPHKALLWRNVLKLQVGIYVNAKAAFEEKGFSPKVSGIGAAHVANRYAGALPQENLHRYLNMAANIVLFSRSYTLGNLGVMKDALKGAPPHVMAAIEAAGGDSAAMQSVLKRKARNAVVIDIAVNVLLRNMLQASFHTALLMGTLGLAGGLAEAYQDWQHKAVLSLEATTHNPFAIAGVMPSAWNEPGKTDRALIGHEKNGTGIYAQATAGRTGAEYTDWLFHPASVATNKLDPILSGSLDLLLGHDHFGRDIFPPNVHTVSGYAKEAGIVVGHLAGSLLPIQALDDAKALATGPDRGGAAWRLAAQMSGLVRLSHGFPGGPQAGVEYAQKKQVEYDKSPILSAARKLQAAGDTDGAIATIEKSDLSDGDKIDLVRYLNRSGGGGITPSQQKRFDASASEADKQLLDQVSR